jgi:translation initiation factor IF-3
MLDRITESLQDLSKVEQPAKMTGRRMKLLIVPK